MRDGNYETAFQTLKEGLRLYPESPTLRAGITAAKTQALDRLVNDAKQLRSGRKFEQAEKVLDRALALDSENPRLKDLQTDLRIAQKLRILVDRANSLVTQGKKEQALRMLEVALRESPRQTELISLQRHLQQEMRLARDVVSGLREARPISLDFKNAPLSLVLDAITRGSGVNFVLDKDVHLESRTTVYLRNVRVGDAIDLVTSANQLARNVVDAQTVFIYPNTPDKRREHQEQVVRVFYLANGQAQTTASLLRSMLRIKDPFVDERTNMVAIRETPEVVALAERLVALHDLREPEVMLELEVMEVSSTVLNNLGLDLPNSITFNPLPDAGANGLTVSGLRTLNSSRVGVGMPNLVLNLRREVGDTNILANPKIRAKNREKAHILIGDKIPIITSTSGATGFVSQSVSYQDVGLKLDVEPVVSPDDDVSIKLSLEVSTLGNAVTTSSGTVAYQIGSRSAGTVLQLHDGETQLLAGLVNKQDASNAHRFPGLGDLPIAGRLFSSQRDDSSRTELVLAVTPRILRSAPNPDIDQSHLWVGSESYTRMLLPPEQRGKAAETPTAVRSATEENTPISSALSTASGAAASTSNAMAPDNSVVARWKAPQHVNAGDEFTATLELDAHSLIRGVALEIVFPSADLDVVEVREGEYFHHAGSDTSFSQSVNASIGRIGISILRSDNTGVSGRATLVELRLKARSAGVVQLQVNSLRPLGMGMPLVVGDLPALKLQVK
jgi:general secretion pathway protein D